MTYPSPNPPGTFEFTGTLLGTVTPGPGFYPLNYTRFASAARQMPGLLLAELGWTLPLTFHTVGRKLNGPGLYRSHWRLNALLGGPGFYPNSAVPSHVGRIDVRMWLYPDSEGVPAQRVEEDGTGGGFIWEGQLAGLIPALLLRRAWGADNPREFTLSDGKTFTFTPSQLGYTAGFGSTTTQWVDINADGVAVLPVYEAPAAPLPGGQVPGSTALWLVPLELDTAWKLSYSLMQGVDAQPANRWDDPAEPVPTFTPLPEP